MSQPLTERRYLCSELVSLLYEDRFRNTHEAMANLEEISSTTVTLLSEKKLESGRPISLRAQGHDLYGVVESSAFDPLLGWYIKVKLDHFSRWHERPVCSGPLPGSVRVDIGRRSWGCNCRCP